MHHGATVEVQLAPDGTAAANPAFDVTPARLVTGLITERGIDCGATRDALRRLQERGHMNDDEDMLRRQAVAAMRRLDALGLNRGSTGNLSQRCTRQGRAAC